MTEQQVLKMQLERGGEKEGEKPIAREAIKLKQIMKRKRIFNKEHEFAIDSNTEQRFICTRILGHK